MIEIIPAKMIEMGLTANAEKVYGKGSFFVVKLYGTFQFVSFKVYQFLLFRTIVAANIEKLLNKSVGAEKANKVNEMLGMLGGQWAKVGCI